MTTINDVSTNDMNFKHLDTTKNIVITPKNEFGGQVLLNTAHTWTAKVSDDTNYVGNYPATLESNSIVVNSADFTKLPTGQYHLEVWEEWTDANGDNQRAIYPSPKETIPFRIYSNITDLAEKEIKTIGFQDVVDQAVKNVGENYVFKVNMIEPNQTATVVQAAADGKNYVTFNIPRGDKGDKGDVGPAPTFKIGTVTKLNSDQTPTVNVSGDNGAYVLDLGIPQGPKGDTGTVDNAGLAAAPAFVNLQTQVNNSAVGTNLLVNTSSSATSGRTTMQGTIGSIGSINRYIRTDSYEEVIAPSSGEFYYRFVSPSTNNLYGLIPGETYTLSGSASHTSGELKFRAQYAVNGTDWRWDETQDISDLGIPVSDGSVFTPFSHTFAIPAGVTGLYFSLENYDYTTGSLFRFKNMKLEKGTTATDWCPNPADVLTQSDYVKIQAAIVALGGSLK